MPAVFPVRLVDKADYMRAERRTDDALDAQARRQISPKSETAPAK
jgi:hypothetical protein